VDRALAAHRLEFEVGRNALRAGRIGRVLEMPAILAALQFDDAAFGRFPERLRPLVWHRDRSCHLAPVAHSLLRPLRCAGNGIGGSSAPFPPGFGAAAAGAFLASASATISRISVNSGGALSPNSKISRNIVGSFQIAAAMMRR